MMARRVARGAALALTLIVASCAGAPAYALDQLEIRAVEKPAPTCQFPNTQGAMMPIPCAFMFALMQKMMGNGCGERTCPVRL